MTTQTKALKLALEALEGADMIDCDMRDAIIAIKEALSSSNGEAQPEPYKEISEHLTQTTGGRVYVDPVNGNLSIGTVAQPEQEKERCVGCEACIDTACGRDECPKGWPKAVQPEQEPVAWMGTDIEGNPNKFRLNQFSGSFPLYAQPQPWTDDLALIAYLDGVRDGRESPQRTWGGLEAEDRLCAKYMQDAPEGIEAVIDYIEAKLKEKNT